MGRETSIRNSPVTTGSVKGRALAGRGARAALRLTSLVIAAIAGLALAVFAARNTPSGEHGRIWKTDNGDGTFTNPILFADYSDPDVIRLADDYYMVSSSFQCAPGIPILHSKDMVNWRIIGHALKRLPSDRYNSPRHGEGCWAPSLRYHNGQFWIYYGDPDLGIYMTKANDASGPWEAPTLVKAARGWIDPCPLWDDDGSMYLVHAWARSRVGFNAILTVNRLSSDGRRVVDDGVTVFEGGPRHPTIEGPKFYKRNGYYYIFAPAGGVKTGWQAVLRSRHVLGPYEDRIVLHQGNTAINGPHQGGWIEDAGGESWFVHFQDRATYGRVVHLQPMAWRNDWPVIGEDRDGDGIGEPVTRAPKPHYTGSLKPEEPQTSDEFNGRELGLQWQWQANPSANWVSLSASRGALRLFSIPRPPSSSNLWSVPNLLLQKFPAPEFTATTLLDARGMKSGSKAGLVIMGLDYAYLAITRVGAEWRVVKVVAKNADRGTPEVTEASEALASGRVYLRASVQPEARCQFSFSRDGKEFTTVGGFFAARPGVWIGAKVGLFSIAAPGSRRAGAVDVDWFRMEASAAGVPARIILVGDSTMAVGSGWGPGFCSHVRMNVACVNMAKRGRSSRSYREEGSWQEVLNELKRNHEFTQTYVLIQFGHNDQPGKPGRSTDLETEFPANLKDYVRDVKTTGAEPVLITPLTRRWFTDGRLRDDLLPWAEATKRVAQEEGVPVLDLHRASVDAIQAMGPVEANTLAMAAPPADIVAAAASGRSVVVPKPRAVEPQTNTEPGASATNPDMRTDSPVPVFDYTHLGDKGAAFFGRMVADELNRVVPGLRPYVKP